MNEIIRIAYDLGISELLYDLFGLLGIIVSYILCVWYGKKLNIKPWRVFLAVTVILIVTFFSIHVIILDAVRYIKETTMIPGILTTSIIRTLLLIPMVACYMSWLLKVKWQTMCDIVVYIPLTIGWIGSIGCLFAGCCAGYSCKFGIYNSYLDDYVFPVQILNAAIMCALSVYLLIRSKRKNYVPDGLSYAIMLIVFGGTRFLTEYLCDNEKVLFGCSVLAIHAVKDFLAGIINYVIIKHRQKAKTKQVQS